MSITLYLALLNAFEVMIFFKMYRKIDTWF